MVFPALSRPLQFFSIFLLQFTQAYLQHQDPHFLVFETGLPQNRQHFEDLFDLPASRSEGEFIREESGTKAARSRAVRCFTNLDRKDIPEHQQTYIDPRSTYTTTVELVSLLPSGLSEAVNLLADSVLTSTGQSRIPVRSVQT